MAGPGSLTLHLEATRHDGRVERRLEPLARRLLRSAFATILPILTYPIRVGTHFNTAFALVLSLEWADAFDPALAELIRDRARHWFGTDRDCQAWEPGGDEFLSPALIEALCMARAHPALRSRSGSKQFLPRITDRQPATLFAPAIVSDRSDGKIAHLDGLNLSRAWCWRELGRCCRPTSGQSPRAPLTITSPRRCRISPATIWANIGSRVSRCSHCCRPAGTDKPAPSATTCRRQSPGTGRRYSGRR